MMHYTGTIWRPPYEASSLLVEVTAGCTHHRCKFCTLYADLPFQFRMSPLENIEADLKEAQKRYRLFIGRNPSRTFLTGANPFVLKYDRLMEIAGMIHKYFPGMETIGSFARVTDITLKSDEEFAALHGAGYDGLTIGIETADDEALRFMDKGYLAADILEQCKRLDQVGIRYSFFYLAGISGAGHGEDGARATAAICNQLHPTMVGPICLQSTRIPGYMRKSGRETGKRKVKRRNTGKSGRWWRPWRSLQSLRLLGHPMRSKCRGASKGQGEAAGLP